MSAPTETEAKPVEPIAPVVVVDGSSLIPAATAAPVEEHKHDAPKAASEPAATVSTPVVEEITAADPEPSKEEAKIEDKPTETTEPEAKDEVKRTGLLAKFFGKKDKAVKEVKQKSPKSPKKKKAEKEKKKGETKEETKEKKEENKEEKQEEKEKEEAPTATDLPKEEPKEEAQPAPAVEETPALATDPVKETETAPADSTAAEVAKETKVEAAEKVKETKIQRRFSTRLVQIFKPREPKQKDGAPAVPEEAPKLDEVAKAAPLETEAKVEPPAPVVEAAA